MLENRRWKDVGGPGFASMPYLHRLARSCAFYTNWSETNPHQNSLTQYIGLTSGVDNPATMNDCLPSTTCRSTDNNIFRQVRDAGGTARSYVDSVAPTCAIEKGFTTRVPALYYYGANDHAHCAREVLALTYLDVNHLPTFAIITPNLCHSGHNCANGTVDAWLSIHLTAILHGSSYRTGTTAVFVCYDEDRPVPNLLVAPTAHAGPLAVSGAGHAAALRTFEDLLGLPVLPAVQKSISLRDSSGM